MVELDQELICVTGIIRQSNSIQEWTYDKQGNEQYVTSKSNDELAAH
jgi:hypothetical protein